MSLVEAAKVLADNYLGAQYSSPEEQQHNRNRALELDFIVMRLEQKEARNGSLPHG
jgi:hypothetical protein